MYIRDKPLFYTHNNALSVIEAHQILDLVVILGENTNGVKKT